MLKPVSIQNIRLACLADCPADNHARQLAQFLYETFKHIRLKPTNVATLLRNSRPIGNVLERLRYAKLLFTTSAN